MPSIRIKRGTRAQLDTAATAGQLAAGELYLITDEGRLAVGLSADTYKALAMMGEPGLHAGAVAWPKRTATPRIVGDIGGTALNTISTTDSRQYFFPFSVPRVVALTGLRISIITGKNGTASVGIYANTVVSGNDNPGSLLASAIGINTSSAVDKDGALSLTLEPGLIYWASLICSASIQLRALAVASVAVQLGRSVGDITAITHLYAAGSGSTLPDPAPTSLTNGTGAVPAIYLLE